MSLRGALLQAAKRTSSRSTASAVAKRGVWQGGELRSCSFASQAAKGESEVGNGLVAWYLAQLAARPVVTKSLTAGTIFFTSDMAAQAITHFDGQGKPDWFRSARMTGCGLILAGPTLHLWFNTINKLIPGRDAMSIVGKMVAGQLTYGPAFNATFFSINGALQGESREEIWERLKRDILPTMKAGLLYWPFCDAFTYAKVPVHLMPLANNAAAFFWTVYLAYVGNAKKAGHSSGVEEAIEPDVITGQTIIEKRWK